MRQATPRPLTAMFCITLMICVFAFAPLCAGYSVLTHEEIIDLLWDQQIQPLLLARFPDASPQDLVKAHAYAYGGSVVQDIGYYPFGNHVFSDLTHYVRTGDFVLAMLSDAQDLDDEGEETRTVSSLYPSKSLTMLSHSASSGSRQ